MSLPESTAFSIKTHGEYANFVRVLLRGELDMSTVGQFNDVIGQHREHGRDVLLDLSELEFIDSTGIRAVIQATEEAQVNGWNMGINAVLSPQVERVFEMTQLLPRLPLMAA